MHCFSEQSRLMGFIVMAAELKLEYLKLSDLIEIVNSVTPLLQMYSTLVLPNWILFGHTLNRLENSTWRTILLSSEHTIQISTVIGYLCPYHYDQYCHVRILCRRRFRRSLSRRHSHRTSKRLVSLSLPYHERADANTLFLKHCFLWLLIVVLLYVGTWAYS